ncbi:hypothetical protein FACS1894190_05000 [Spirochaetia bacterium]|nr:hypothetical protein FACS1894190_05000 [Spirochaetia bacterium]
MTRIERICGERIPPYIILFVTAVFAIIFFLRHPVVLVSDEYFSLLYGVKRQHYKIIEQSLEIFRRIKIINIDGDASTDAIVMAVQDVSKKPHCVIFPFRYSNAAVKYSESTAELNSPTVLSGGFNKRPDNIRGVFFVSSDYKTDFLRAGICAAQLTTISDDKSVQADLSEKNIFLITPVKFPDGVVDIFTGAVQRVRGNVNIITPKQHDSFTQTPSAGVVCGPASSLINKIINQNVPLIVYSWLDPTFMPESVKITIDDSVFTQIPRIIRALNKKTYDDHGDILIPSTFKILRNRIHTSRMLLELRKAVIFTR